MADEIRHLFKGFFNDNPNLPSWTVLRTWCGKGLNNAYIEPRLMTCEECGAARKLFLTQVRAENLSKEPK